ncbi:type-F conjugative transfer system pilin assembly thiol-disulfide isomerase TrbB [Legionella pneumophila]|uniref:type-F conjugative transfer system pilin assembly thiol-disulfide isomerase TrbB n=1 Tax=Legionella pneumophila TaxID=446 RepID=UPI000776E5FB|nr:type-F conjugative transfer system pilin assembly thiol-disulfide isomerase TrbB [Legionella pneumophila]HAT8643610.1 type-F conjugative transfer system pilin assembly thiol-disulfide isomerase TrbB [Legionella pneumophila]
MKNRLIIILILSMQTMCSFAGQGWLNQMIVSKAKGDLNNPELTKSYDGFFKHHALVLFYASTCPHCHQFAPEIKRWAEHQQAEVLALSFDNQPLPDFPHFLPATTEWVNAAYAGRSISYPALFVVNKETHVLYPVAIGSMTSSELDIRMMSLIPKIKAYEDKRISA